MRVLLLPMLLLFMGCKTKLTNSPAATNTLFVLPLNGMPAKISNNITNDLKKHFPDVRLLPQEPIPANAYYALRNRYRADSIIQWLQQRARSGEKYIALTTADISTGKNNVKDWGVMGLAYRPGQACVASSYRLKDKNNFYKVVIHELAHTSGLPHCPDRNCYLRDAKGGDHTSNERSFCKDCTARLTRLGWKL